MKIHAKAMPVMPICPFIQMAPKFRRQVPFDRFVLDFNRHASKLVADPPVSGLGPGAELHLPFDVGFGPLDSLSQMGVPTGEGGRRSHLASTRTVRGHSREQPRGIP